MRIIRYLARSINPLNILLLIIVVAAAVIVLFPLMKMNAGYSLPQIKLKTVDETEKPQEKSGNILPSDYTVIGELNLFHPERRVPVDKKADEIPKPELILYGTMVQDNVQYAFIEDKKSPKTTPGRGNRQTTVKKGDVVGGFIVSEIKADRITLTKGDETMVVLLANTDKRKDSTGAQRPTQTTTPGTPSQTTPGSPFGATPGTTGPMQQVGGRPSGAPPIAQPPTGPAPQPLPRPAAPGAGRGAPGTLPIPTR
jgi:hypothetical protein